MTTISITVLLLINLFLLICIILSVILINKLTKENKELINTYNELKELYDKLLIDNEIKQNRKYYKSIKK